jgi:hypothetical protein
LFQASLFNNDDEVGICAANFCHEEYLMCQVSVECALGEDTDTKKSLDTCMDTHCVVTPKPTSSPTARPSASGDTLAKGNGLFF